jgi:hypothetical protein
VSDRRSRRAAAYAKPSTWGFLRDGRYLWPYICRPVSSIAPIGAGALVSLTSRDQQEIISGYRHRERRMTRAPIEQFGSSQ